MPYHFSSVVKTVFTLSITLKNRRETNVFVMKIEENTFNVISQHRGIWLWYSHVSLYPGVDAASNNTVKKSAGSAGPSSMLSCGEGGRGGLHPQCGQHHQEG